MPRTKISRIASIGVLMVLQVFLTPNAAGKQILHTAEALANEAGIAQDWRMVHADAQLSFTDVSQHSLKLNTSGYPSIAFGGDHLYFAQFNGTTWSLPTVDPAWGVGRGAALALDGNGKAHISYYDANNADLKYATNKSGSWVIQTVAWQGDVGKYSDIAIDSWGDPSIVYFDQTAGELRYTNYDSTTNPPGWYTNERIADASGSSHNGWFSFALDTSVIPNKPHVSFFYDNELKYAYYNASYNWTSALVTSCISTIDCAIGEYNSLALDPATQKPTIGFSYHDAGFGDLLAFYSFDGTYWYAEIVESGTPTYVSLAYDTIGDTRKARLIWKQNGLKYAYRLGADDWSTTATVDASASAGEWASLAVVGSTPKVVHYNTSSKSLIFVDHDRNGWLAPHTLSNQGHEVGKCSSLAVDKQGYLHISYFDSTSNSLLYIQYGNLEDDPLIMNTIDLGATNCFSVIALNAANNPSVGYVRGGNLYLRSLSGSGWTGEMLVDTGISGSFDYYQAFGMALDSIGYPHFAYRKGNDLWYAYWTGSSWSRSLRVDELATSGAVALALSPSNRVSIAYYEGSTLMHLITHPLQGWISEVIASSGTFYGVALAVDPGGNVMAAYLGSVGMDLYFSRRTNICVYEPPYSCIWSSSVVVDDQGEDFFSLAVDRQGIPHLAAGAWVSGFELHYITQQGTSWLVQQVDTNEASGPYPSIALTPGGTPRISYLDWLNYDLKVVYQLDQVFLPVVRR